MTKSHRITAATLALLLLALAATPTFAQKIKIEKLDDLPRHTYKLEIKAVELFDNDEVLNRLMTQVRRDLLSDLETYEIPDKNTLIDYYGTLR